jgi:two-component system OmpR family sensor kinase
VTIQANQPSREQLAVCAHDVRGALTVINGYVSMLRRAGLSDQERARALEGIEKAVFRADALLGDALMGRVPTSQGIERVDLVALADQAVADAQAAWNRDVTLEVSWRPFVDADPISLARALENLLSNAAKYAPEGQIDVTVGVASEAAVIEVSDRGPGIPEDEREHVLEPFARLDRDAETPGSGLGLTVVRSAMERMGGEVRVLERDGGGTTFRLELPLA